MKFIRMLLVVVVGVLGLDVEGMQPQAPVQTVFDLPADTLGLIDGKQTKAVCGEDKACVHVIVPKSEAEDAYHDPKLKPLNAKERVDCALSKKGNIYFPADGTQPTTEEAAKYSCANIDNTENSPITEWYMKMFGVIDKNGGNSDNDDDYVKIDGKQIVTFGSNVKVKTKNSFKKMFNEMAADPVGRMLLYRLLIEICRYNPKSMKGCTEKAWQMLGKENKRNALRHILVEYVEYVWQFSWWNSILSFNDQNYSTYAVKIYNNNDTWVTRYGTTPMVVYLFHEMLHWFHNIQYYGRYSDDNIKKSLGQYLLNFGKFVQDPQIWNGQSFGMFEQKSDRINGEEVATILGKGIKIDGDANYENGDELSENLFSCSLTERSQGKIRATMRWGHALLPINDDQSTKEVMQCAYDNVIQIMSKITGQNVNFWEMKNGGAFLAENEISDIKQVTAIISGMCDTIAKTESLKNGILDYLKKIYVDVQ